MAPQDSMAAKMPRTFSAGILLLGELREDVFERGLVHQVAQAFHGVVRHHLALAQNQHARAHLLHYFQHVRAVEYDALPRAISRSSVRSTRAVVTSSPENGSSKISTRGLWIRAPEIRIFCRMPLE